MWSNFEIQMGKLREHARSFPVMTARIEKVIFNNPATIVFFEDGEKIVVKANNEEFNKEKGVAMAVMRKLYSRNEFKKIVKNGIDQEIKEVKEDYEFKVGDKVRIVKNSPNITHTPRQIREMKKDIGKVFTIEEIHNRSVYPYTLTETIWTRKKEELELVEKGE